MSEGIVCTPNGVNKGTPCIFFFFDGVIPNTGDGVIPDAGQVSEFVDHVIGVGVGVGGLSGGGEAEDGIVLTADVDVITPNVSGIKAPCIFFKLTIINFLLARSKITKTDKVADNNDETLSSCHGRIDDIR